MNHIVFTFGRFQPPTTGHYRNFVELIRTSKKVGGIPHIFVSSKFGDDRNPLLPEKRIQYLRDTINDQQVIIDQAVDAFKIIENVAEQGIPLATFIIGGDYFTTDTTGVLQRLHMFAADRNVKLTCVNSGDRMTNMSGTLAREAARSGDFDLFKKLTRHNTVTEEMQQELFYLLQLKIETE